MYTTTSDAEALLQTAREHARSAASRRFVARMLDGQPPPGRAAAEVVELRGVEPQAVVAATGL